MGMPRFTRRAAPGDRPVTTLTLTLEQRGKSRLRVTLDDGTEAGLLLERGGILWDGDLITGDEGLVVQVMAAPEPLSRVHCDDPLLLARACYHLGNRHVPLQIESNRLSFLHDHVLDEMLRGLGLEPLLQQAPFRPEPGAYGGNGGGHEHHHH